MDLTKHRAFKHGFLHACRHRPQEGNASGQREPVANYSRLGGGHIDSPDGLRLGLSSAFVLRHSKLARRDHLTTIAVAAQLDARVSTAPPSIRAPA
jgi:hypothetical protein